jgi:hypothetical protein
MRILDTLLNNFVYGNKYKTHSEAIIVSCYFNPQNNPYRLKAFNTFYDSIKHLNHRIVECVIGDDQPQLPVNEHITRVYTTNVLWHKEALLNGIIKNLDPKYKYVFWLDADVIFTNNSWLTDSVKQLKTLNMVQPFEYCVHLEKDQMQPDFDITHEYKFASHPKHRHPRMWRSFCSNHPNSSHDEVYDVHGHVGFAWGARREVLDAMPLYDRALVGGADHIMAHAAAGHIPHKCITKSFTEDIDAVNRWSRKFYNVVRGKLGYAKGDLYHIWHGALESREYLKRVREFTPESKKISEKDDNGLYVTHDDSYVKSYFEKRENTGTTKNYPQVKKSNIGWTATQKAPVYDDNFVESLVIGYATDNAVMGGIMGGNMLGGIIGDALNTNDEINDNDNNQNFS